MPIVRRPGADVWWEASGQGPPLLLVQGLGYSSAAWWRLLPGLSEQHTVLVVDNRGVGRTGVPPDRFTIETMADDAAAVVEAAGRGPAHVFGASLGGLVVQELALRHPELVRSLILGCTSPGGREAVPFDRSAQELLDTRADLSPREAAEAAVPLVYADSTSRTDVAADIDIRLRLPTQPKGYAAQLAAVYAYGGTYTRLDRLACPTLILHGTADRLVPPANAQLLADRIAGAKLCWLEGAGHVFTTDRTALTLEALCAFTRELTTPACATLDARGQRP